MSNRGSAPFWGRKVHCQSHRVKGTGLHIAQTSEKVATPSESTCINGLPSRTILDRTRNAGYGLYWLAGADLRQKASSATLQERPPLPSPPNPLPSPPFSIPSPLIPFPCPPLEVRPSNPARGSGGALFTYLWLICTKFDLGWALPRTPAEGAYSKSVRK